MDNDLIYKQLEKLKNKIKLTKEQEEKKIKAQIITKLDRMWQKEIFNKYGREDFGEYIKELEKEYKCEIDEVSWNIKFKD